jgi:hypothetical protein
MQVSIYHLRKLENNQRMHGSMLSPMRSDILSENGLRIDRMSATCRISCTPPARYVISPRVHSTSTRRISSDRGLNSFFDEDQDELDIHVNSGTADIKTTTSSSRTYSSRTNVRLCLLWNRTPRKKKKSTVYGRYTIQDGRNSERIRS